MADPFTLPLPEIRRPARTPVSTDFSHIRSREAAEATAKEFEAMFLSQMLQPLFADLSTDAPFGGGAAERAFRPLLVDEYAKALADQGGIGLADTVLTEILRLQGLE